MAKDKTPAVHPVIMALVEMIPAAGTVWDIEDRCKWLRAMVAVFDLIYDVEVPKPSPQQVKRFGEKALNLVAAASFEAGRESQQKNDAPASG